ncbi:MAG: Rrf2 family transcriptional regulator [Gemmatimonadaceae bacterium]
MLSQTAEYALRATVYISRQKPRAVRIPEIASAVHAPPRYLAKILGLLARAGFLESSRGPAGGFRAAPRGERASLAAIVAVFEATEPRRCLLGHGTCGLNPSCAVHQKWAPIAQATAQFFAHTSIGDLLSPPHSYLR